MKKHGLALPYMACSQASKSSTWKGLITSNEVTPCPGQVPTFPDHCSSRSGPRAWGAHHPDHKRPVSWEMLGNGLQGSDIYCFPNLSWLCLPPRKKCGFDFIVGESQTPCNVLLEAAWRLPGSWRALCGLTKARAWAQKDLVPCC